MSDSFAQFSDAVTSPSGDFAAITPADSDLARIPKALYVGGGGTVVATPARGGAAVTFTVLGGTYLMIRPRRIAVASSATGIVGLY